jgi:hypothetical protein
MKNPKNEFCRAQPTRENERLPRRREPESCAGASMTKAIPVLRSTFAFGNGCGASRPSNG